MAHIEKLEGRKLLSGNVTAAFEGYTLTITGDAQSNQIAVSTSEDGRTTTITPLQGTTINGSVDPAHFPYAEVVIDTGNGDDFVALTKFDLQDCLLTTGNGSDTVVAAESNLFFNLKIDTGAGGDDVTIAGQTGVDGDIRIDTGTGKERVTIAGDLWVKSDDIIIAGGNGSDVLDRSGFTGTLPPAGIIDIEVLIA